MRVSYDGTNYFGWQKTRDFPTIQGELEKACGRILQEEVACEASSRTDRGVHAMGQIVQFFTAKEFEVDRLRRALNAVLPPDIRVLEVKEGLVGFHPSLDARAKTYRYNLCLGIAQNPFERKFSWHYPYPIDLEKMVRAGELLLGERDFSAFTTEPQTNNVRELLKIDLIELPEERLSIEMTADRFLYKMARTIAGTLANIGSGKLDIEAINPLFTAKNRALAGVTAPAHGLLLKQVHYANFPSPDEGREHILGAKPVSSR